MSHLSLLEDYLSCSNRILDVLSKDCLLPVQQDMNTSTVTVPHLPKQGTFAAELRARLHSRALGETLIESICDLYQSRCCIWQEKIQVEWIKSYTRLVGLGGKASTLRLMQKACIANLSRGMQCMQDDVLSLIDERIEKYRIDSEAAASASSGDQFSDSDDDDNARGHSAEAVAILEAAYAYTTNITQAEKRRLAQATGLEPRQVVIWFQNRRNRKVKSRTEAGAPSTAVHTVSPSAHLARKRKMSCNDAASPRRPSSFVTPEKKARLPDMPPPPIDRRLLSGSSNASVGSSIDSRTESLLSGWAGSERYGQQRAVSSESAATSYTSPSICSSFASTLASEECSSSTRVNAQEARRKQPASVRSEQEQAFAQRLLPSSPAHGHREPPPAEIAHIFNDGQEHLASCGLWGSSNFLFTDDSDVPRLDFDDLGLEPADFGKEGSLLFDFAAPPPAGGAQLWQRGPPMVGVPSGTLHNQYPFAATSTTTLGYALDPSASAQDRTSSRPRHFTDVAESLNEGDFNLFAALASLPTFKDMSPDAILQFAASGGHDLSVDAERTRYAQSLPTLGSSPSSSTPREKDIVTPPSRVADANSPEDFAFTFDFAELGLDRSFAEIRKSYRVADEEAKMYSISEVEDEEGGGATSGWETGPEEMKGRGTKRSSSGTIISERHTSSETSSGPWAIPARPVDLHGQRQAGGRFFAS
ncbi:hypothetical protein BCV69DRAFT_313751 [Microstroma glucosiphilum]|uniref:Homeobox domain-containing protein n=1 Tax=Pseudomicrostroma glucosiphilum TaxID=1684307 RepID=A0A316U3W9_9BASI|nr:hypothetical protein BCV69DRAFT_313751 [Pseudomicrostroma glucosiphilum]PWN19498.1 hypothetical protein BCV69DRAFT_313751 [Pseudomicrostroma glucosiphilum]